MTRTVLIYTIYATEDTDIRDNDKTYELKMHWQLPVRPLKGERIRVFETDYPISSITHDQHLLEINVGFEEWTFKGGTNPDEVMPQGLLKKVVTMLSESWHLYDGDGKMMRFEPYEKQMIP